MNTAESQTPGDKASFGDTIVVKGSPSSSQSPMDSQPEQPSVGVSKSSPGQGGLVSGKLLKAEANSERDLRAIRRSWGLPAPSRHIQSQPQGSVGATNHPKLEAAFDPVDLESPLVQATDQHSTSHKGEADIGASHFQVAKQNKLVNSPKPNRILNMIPLRDSKFSANRTGLRGWRDLRYVRLVWSAEEEEKLRRDCLVIADEPSDLSASNTLLWTACFDRYCVPLNDLFTYGLQPHPSSQREAFRKLLSARFCDHLMAVLVHPIFEGDLVRLRYVLQRIVRLRVGLHVPPMGPMPELDDNDYELVIAATLRFQKDDSYEAKKQARSDALMFMTQKRGANFYPEIVKLEEAINVDFELNDLGATAPNDNVPYSRSLFFLQEWDLKFLLKVLEDMSSHTEYLPVETYKTMWLAGSGRIQSYVGTKMDSIIESWYLHDERNYRLRQKFKHAGAGQYLFDIAEEDFEPLYAGSQYLTSGMQGVLRGDYLTAQFPPKAEDGQDREGDNAGALNKEELQGDQSSLPHDVPVASIEDDDAGKTAKVAGIEEQPAVSVGKRKLDAEADNNDKSSAENRTHRNPSFASFHSLASSDSEYEDREITPDDPNKVQYPRRFLPRSDRNM